MKGPLYGCRLLVLTELNADGTEKAPGTERVVRVEHPQQVGFEPQITEGQKQELRGGDGLVATVEDQDVFTGMNATLQDAILDLDALALIGGGASAPISAIAAALQVGTVAANNAILFRAKAAGAAGNAISIRLVDGAAINVAVVGNAITITADVDADTAAEVIEAVNAHVGASALVVASHVTGSTGAGIVVAVDPARNLSGGVDATAGNESYAAPTIADQQTPRLPFRAEIYCTEYAEGSQDAADVTGYAKVTLWYCRGRVPSFTQQDRNFLVPSYQIKSKENKGQNKPAFSIEKVAALPAA